MPNLTPNPPLSSYKRLNCLLSGNQEEREDIHLVQVRPNLTDENLKQPMSGPITSQSNSEGLKRQSSSQRQKRHTSEEEQLYQQKLEHECMLKRK
ncbi:hypothetical protein O181_063451 [Austropuccinia psidii MF-1]|uniref:Uncharacterized protein n=1 Tax=Austropuccinia psidii MF-1 TaxID=1389203 RepID=A0A9Q3HZF2_9BASI|nr:hypothetical protein [Austropuccinia psidii MF-1]